MFAADPRYLVKGGHGNVDDISDRIIKDGDIHHWPKAQQFSNHAKGCPHASVDDESLSFTGTSIFESGHLFNKQRHNLDFKVKIQESNGAISIKFSIDDQDSVGNFMVLNYESPHDEEIYGLGLQYTQWNFKGVKVPIITSEAGVGRGAEPLTTILNVYGSKGGNHWTTYSPSYSHITNKKRSFIFNTTTIGHLDFHSFVDRTTALFWHVPSVELILQYGDSPKALAGGVSKRIGTMRPMPDWIMNGAIVGLQGGELVIK